MKKLDRTKSYDKRWNMAHLKEKYSVKNDVIANHVADFDYPTPEFIFKQIIKRCDFKSLSYTGVDDEYYQSFIFWYKQMKGFDLKKEWINNSYGVIFSMAGVIDQYSKPKDKILVNSPCYSPLQRVVLVNDRKVVFNKLKQRENKYYFDFQIFEEQIIKEKIKIFIFCNPLNPTGRLWTLDELNKIAEICYRNNVIVMSDEVHGDLISYKDGFNSIIKTDDKYKNNVVVVSSATKAFNIGGIASSYFISKNIELLKKVYDFQQKVWLTNGHIFALEVMKAGYSNEGIKWIEEMKSNHEFLFDKVVKFIKENKLPLEPMDLDSGFCAMIKIKDDLEKLDEYKDKFNKNGLLVRFSDDFSDFDNLWFRLILSTDEEDIDRILEKLVNIFRR